MDERALQLCDKRWSSKEKQGFAREELDKEIEQKMKVAQEKGSLLEMVCADPAAFCKISFVFTDRIVTEEEASQAKEDIIESSGEISAEEEKEILDWPREDIFSDWKKDQIWKMGSLFINFHFSSSTSRKLFIVGYETAHGNRKQGCLLGKRNYSGIKQFIFAQNKAYKIPNAKNIAERDKDIILLLREKMIGEVLTSFELKGEIENFI